MTKWSEHVKKHAKKHKMSYREASMNSKCKESYHKMSKKRMSPRKMSKKRMSPRKMSKKRMSPKKMSKKRMNNPETNVARFDIDLGIIDRTEFTEEGFEELKLRENDIIEISKNLIEMSTTPDIEVPELKFSTLEDNEPVDFRLVLSFNCETLDEKKFRELIGSLELIIETSTRDAIDSLIAYQYCDN
jgi:hypothetical protein